MYEHNEEGVVTTFNTQVRWQLLLKEPVRTLATGVCPCHCYKLWSLELAAVWKSEHHCSAYNYLNKRVNKAEMIRGLVWIWPREADGACWEKRAGPLMREAREGHRQRQTTKRQIWLAENLIHCCRRISQDGTLWGATWQTGLTKLQNHWIGKWREWRDRHGAVVDPLSQTTIQHRQTRHGKTGLLPRPHNNTNALTWGITNKTEECDQQ